MDIGKLIHSYLVKIGETSFSTTILCLDTYSNSKTKLTPSTSHVSSTFVPLAYLLKELSQIHQLHDLFP